MRNIILPVLAVIGACLILVAFGMLLGAAMVDNQHENDLASHSHCMCQTHTDAESDLDDFSHITPDGLEGAMIGMDDETGEVITIQVE